MPSWGGTPSSGDTSLVPGWLKVGEMVESCPLRHLPSLGEGPSWCPLSLQPGYTIRRSQDLPSRAKLTTFFCPRVILGACGGSVEPRFVLLVFNTVSLFLSSSKPPRCCQPKTARRWLGGHVVIFFTSLRMPRASSFFLNHPQPFV